MLRVAYNVPVGVYQVDYYLKLRAETDAEAAETTLYSSIITVIDPCTPGYTAPTGMLAPYTYRL